MRKCKLICAALLATVVLAGCQNNPESSIVKNKDMDKLLEQAKETPKPNVSNDANEDVKQMQEKYNSFKTSLSDKKLKVSVEVDAKVDIPKVDKMSVLKVKQAKISQDLLDKVRKKMFGNQEIYDGGATDVETKQQLEKHIKMLQQEKESIASVKTNTQEDIDAKQAEIDELREQYEKASDKIDVTGVKSDGKIHKVSDKVAEGKYDRFYSWEKELNPDGDVFYGVNDGSNGWYESLYAQNNKNYANCIRYSKTKFEYLSNTKYVTVDSTDIAAGSERVCAADEDISKMGIYASRSSEGAADVKWENDTVKITEEEALSKAKDLIKNLGIDNFEYNEGGLFNELLTSETSVSCRKVYIFKFARTIDGVMLFSEGEKMASDYTKQTWPAESIEVKINDDGIVEFSYNAPLEVTETVVDKSNMKKFDEIKNIFEKMVLVANASKYYNTNIKVNEVKLRYERISEENSFDTGLLIPAWDFKGTKQSEKEGARDCSILTINAIDGSVINRELGY